MNRLTMRLHNGEIIWPIEYRLDDLISKLAAYEDEEEQGRLVQLPCKVGDKLYWISDEDDEGNLNETIRETPPVDAIAMKRDGFYVQTDGDDCLDKIGTRYAYLTKEEAEQALEQMRGERA